ncbi:MAG: hypothetical protein AAGG55_16860, partial [Pseudomonadota bacterium]
YVSLATQAKSFSYMFHELSFVLCSYTSILSVKIAHNAMKTQKKHIITKALAKPWTNRRNSHCTLSGTVGGG